MNYLGWNKAIATHFFNPQVAQRPVYLYVTQDLINHLGRGRGLDVRDFVSCVRRGPPWITVDQLSLCQKAYLAFLLWRENSGTGKHEYPPYLAYLALFVLAAGFDGDFAPHAYYPRLHKVLGEDERSGSPLGFDNMWHLWRDLEFWSKSDRDGEIGLFDFRISGDWRHVGLPIAQTLLSESDRHKLPSLFARCAFDSKSPPNESELLVLLRKHARDTLQRRTFRLLSSSDTSTCNALVSAVVSELEHWDGSVNTDDGNESRRVTCILRLCCLLDSTAMTARMGLRCKANAEYPETGLILTKQDGFVTLMAEEHGYGWSSELSCQQDSLRFNASSLDWTQSLEMHDSTHAWLAVMRSAEVRIFENGASMGLPGYVEASRIGRRGEYLVAACRHLEVIRQWGREECEDFQELNLSAGLPSGWHLFRIKSVKSDRLVRRAVPRLTLPSSIRIHLRGGISFQDSGRSRFFSFARPMVAVEAPTEEINVTCDGKSLLCDDESGGLYRLPPSLPVNQTIRIEVKSPSGDHSQRFLQLVDTVFSSSSTSGVRFGPFGQRLPDGSQGTIGSSLDFTSPAKFDYGAALVPIESRSAFLIGPVPGQVSKWPSDPRPAWAPAWVVMKEKRNGRVVPCMNDVEAAEPVWSPTGDPASVRLWKKVVSFSRRRFTPPADPEFAEIWNRYRQVARYV